MRKKGALPSPQGLLRLRLRLDGLVSPRIGLGQSVHHIHATDPEVAAICSERTLRRILCDGLLSAKAHELRRYVRC